MLEACIVSYIAKGLVVIYVASFFYYTNMFLSTAVGMATHEFIG